MNTVLANNDIVTVTGFQALKTFAAFYADPISCVEKMYRRFGERIALRAPFLKPANVPQSYLFVGPEYNKKILLNPRSFRPTGAWPVPGAEGTSLHNLRRNILCLTGEEHDAHLTAILPLMGKSRVRSLFDQVKHISDEEVGKWPLDRDIDITDYARRLTQRLAFELLFDADGPQTSLQFGELVDDFHKKSWRRGALAFRFDAPYTPYHDVLKSAEALERYTLEWNTDLNECPHSKSIRSEVSTVRWGDGKTASEKQAAANVAAIAMAAYETSAQTLSWALFLLTQHPEIHRSLVAELNSIGPLSDSDAATLDAQTMLDNVLKETMRLIAPVPLIGFVVTEPCEVDGVILNEGARVFISPHLTHRMDSIYAEPRRFMPDRWNTIKPSAYEYLPFNAGPRRCPGIWFAGANLKTALATILTKYHVSLAQGAKIDRGYAATTIAKSGVPIRLTPRHDRFEQSPCSGSIKKFFDAPLHV